MIPGDGKGVGKKHMVIRFEKETGTYSIQDLGQGLGTFVKIVEPFPVANNALFFFGPIQCSTRLSSGERLPDSEVDKRYLVVPRT